MGRRHLALLGSAGPMVALVLALAGCESSTPAFPVPGGLPVRVLLDTHFGGYALGQWPGSATRGAWTTDEYLGTWTVDEFNGELTKQLTKYNVRVVEKTDSHDVVAKIDLGIWFNRHVVEVFLDSDGVPVLAGRVGVPDLNWTTLDAAAEPVAQVIARKAWGISEPPPPPDHE